MCALDFFNLGDPEMHNGNPPGQGNWGLWALAGFIISGVLAFLRVRFAWWPLDPVGLVYISSAWQLGWGGLYFAAFGAWIAKFLVIRLGGTRVYEHYAIPFVTGITAGVLIVGYFIGNIIAPLKFFFP